MEPTADLSLSPAEASSGRRWLGTLNDLGHWAAAAERARLRRVASWVFVFGVAGFLFFRLHAIGWAILWEARPTSPAYYLLVLFGYLTLPTADTLIYRRLWNIPFWPSFSAFLRKRIYNSALIGYSGEVFLMIWARGRVAQSDGQIAHMIKDTNILSAVVSTYVSAALILYLLTHAAFHGPASGVFEYWAMGTLLFAILAPIAFMFRHHFMVLSVKIALIVLGIHAARFLIGQFFLLAQWHAELANIGWGSLITLLAIQMLVNRIPFVPNRDLLFVSISIALSGSLEMPQAELASLLLTTSALQLVLHLLVITGTALRIPGGRRLKPG